MLGDRPRWRRFEPCRRTTRGPRALSGRRLSKVPLDLALSALKSVSSWMAERRPSSGRRRYGDAYGRQADPGRREHVRPPNRRFRPRSNARRGRRGLGAVSRIIPARTAASAALLRRRRVCARGHPAGETHRLAHWVLQTVSERCRSRWSCRRGLASGSAPGLSSGRRPVSVPDRSTGCGRDTSRPSRGVSSNT